MNKIIELTLKVSLIPNVDIAKLAAYNTALAEAVPVVFEDCTKETATEPVHVESNVTLVMTDALIEWHKAMVERQGNDGVVERVGSEALAEIERDVIVPAIKEAFAQACDMAAKDAIYCDPDAESVIVHDYRKDDSAVMEGEKV